VVQLPHSKGGGGRRSPRVRAKPASYPREKESTIGLIFRERGEGEEQAHRQLQRWRKTAGKKTARVLLERRVEWQ